MATEYETIVVGLGAAGVTAASTLARAGRQVLALEALDRIGGRVHSVPFGDGVVEVGAEWIHGTVNSRPYDLANKNNITVVPQDLTMEAYRSDGSKTDAETFNDLLEFCLSVAVDEETRVPDRNETLGNYITEKLNNYISQNKTSLLSDPDYIKGFTNFMHLMINNYEASNDWNDISVYTKYTELEGHQHMSWHRHGYKTFFELLLNTYNHGPGLPYLDIKLKTEVTNINWPANSNGLVTVTCKDGKIYKAKYVIVTISIGVLKERHQTLFTPKLPQDKITAIEKQEMGVMDKIMLSFDNAWWPIDKTFFGFVWKEADLKKVAKDDFWITRILGASRPMGASNVLTLWTSGDAAKLVETLPEDVVMRKCVELLQMFMGRGITVPNPNNIIRTKWFTNRYARGSYSHDNVAAVNHPHIRETLAAPLTDAAGKPRVLFAGEATDNIHFSTVHGASDTGYREAMRILPSSKL